MQTFTHGSALIATGLTLALFGCRVPPTVTETPSPAAEDQQDIVIISDAGRAPTCDVDGHEAVLATFAGMRDFEEPMLINWRIRFPSRGAARVFASAADERGWWVGRDSPNERTVVRKAMITAESVATMHEQVVELAPGAAVSCWALGPPTRTVRREHAA